MPIENDFLFSQENKRTYTWDVYADGDIVAKVQADTASHACSYVCRTRWLSRDRLTARPCEDSVNQA